MLCIYRLEKLLFQDVYVHCPCFFFLGVEFPEFLGDLEVLVGGGEERGGERRGWLTEGGLKWAWVGETGPPMFRVAMWISG